MTTPTTVGCSSHHVAARWPDAVIREYDPRLSGRLPEAFAGRRQ